MPSTEEDGATEARLKLSPGFAAITQGYYRRRSAALSEYGTEDRMESEVRSLDQRQIDLGGLGRWGD